MTEGNTGTPNQKWKALVDHLVSLTHKDRLIWKESVEDETFITSIGENVVSIERTNTVRDGQRTPIIVISVLGNDGKAIDRFDDEDIGSSYWGILSDLVSSISRKVSGADEVLDDLLSELSAIDGSKRS